MDVTVAVCTYGDREWQLLAESRAVPSAQAQAPVVRVHGETLHGARNEALAAVQTEWVVFLDADDQLAPDYVEQMSEGSADVRGPMVRYIDGRKERDWQPRVWGHKHDCHADCLHEGNWLVIGSAVRTQIVRDVGGFRDFPWSEDWDCWLRCYKAGATFELVREATYIAHVRHDSRNRGATRAEKLAAHQAIYAANFPEAAAA